MLERNTINVNIDIEALDLTQNDINLLHALLESESTDDGKIFFALKEYEINYNKEKYIITLSQTIVKCLHKDDNGQKEFRHRPWRSNKAQDSGANASIYESSWILKFVKSESNIISLQVKNVEQIGKFEEKTNCTEEEAMQYMESLQNEIDITQDINGGRHAVVEYELDLNDNSYSVRSCFFMPKIPEKSFQQAHKDIAHLSFPEKIALIISMLEEYHFFRVKGYIHGDISARNVMFEHVKNKFYTRLIDFGFSQRGDKIEKKKGGTPLYMAIEQLMLEPFDHSAALFSFGILFLQILGPENILDAREKILKMLLDAYQKKNNESILLHYEKLVRCGFNFDSIFNNIEIKNSIKESIIFLLQQLTLLTPESRNNEKFFITEFKKILHQLSPENTKLEKAIADQEKLFNAIQEKTIKLEAKLNSEKATFNKYGEKITLLKALERELRHPKNDHKQVNKILNKWLITTWKFKQNNQSVFTRDLLQSPIQSHKFTRFFNRHVPNNLQKLPSEAFVSKLLEKYGKIFINGEIPANEKYYPIHPTL